jgi:hypothetical protein
VTTSPQNDIKKVLIAHYYDKPRELMLERQSQGTAGIQLTQPTFLPMLVSNASLFIDADRDVLESFKKQFPSHPMVVEILKKGQENGMYVSSLVLCLFHLAHHSVPLMRSIKLQ